MPTEPFHGLLILDKPLGVTSATRSRALPEVPTLAELGVKGFAIVNWYGILVPAGTPPAVVKRLNDELGLAVAMPDVQAQLANAALEPAASSPDGFSRLIDTEIKRWAQVIDDAKIKLE